MNDKDELYAKYRVERADGTPVGQCVVLEFADPIARIGIATWARAMRLAGYTQLADDVFALLREIGTDDE